jgi:hypothetical protein
VDGQQRNFDASADAGNEPPEIAFAAAPIKVVVSSQTFAILALISRRCQPPIPDRIAGAISVGAQCFSNPTQLNI